MVKDGKLDKHGRSNEETPSGWKAEYVDYAAAPAADAVIPTQPVVAAAVVVEEKVDVAEVVAEGEGEKKKKKKRKAEDAEAETVEVVAESNGDADAVAEVSLTLFILS